MNIFRPLLLVILAVAFCNVRAQGIDTVKEWSTKDKLKWADFRACVPTSELNSSTVAVCPHEIIVSPFREEGILRYRVRLIFLKNQAWHKDTSNYALAHEQLHFDIAEVYARKLRKLISEIANRSGSLNDYQAAIEGALLKESDAQKEFDKETAHGIYEKHQFEWANIVAKELELLKGYGS